MHEMREVGRGLGKRLVVALFANDVRPAVLPDRYSGAGVACLDFDVFVVDARSLRRERNGSRSGERLT